jgi:hypothetical protein
MDSRVNWWPLSHTSTGSEDEVLLSGYFDRRIRFDLRTNSNQSQN